MAPSESDGWFWCVIDILVMLGMVIVRMVMGERFRLGARQFAAMLEKWSCELSEAPRHGPLGVSV